MVSNSIDSKRGPGRPREFDPNEALDQAVELFWTHGLEGVDVQRIARAVGVTKPSLYRLFGDKSQLFLRAMKRYSETVGIKPYAAFAAEPELRKAMQALFVTAIRNATAEGRPSGCLVACVAAAQAGQSEQIRLAIQRTLATVAGIVAHRFEREIKSGALPATTPAEVRGRLVVDALQGVMLRARAGATQKELLDDTPSFVELLLR
jgi:AcrR family transcriptional regulator